MRWVPVSFLLPAGSQAGMREQPASCGHGHRSAWARTRGTHYPTSVHTSAPPSSPASLAWSHGLRKPWLILSRAHKLKHGE